QAEDMNMPNIQDISSWTSRTVIRRGQNIHYLVRGEGPLVVLAHGGLGNGQMNWIDTGFADAFADGFQIAIPDSLGHGQSSKPSDPSLYTLKERASDLVAVADDLNADTAWYVGYSMGGWTVAGVATHFPERCDGVVVGGWDVEQGMYRVAPSFGLEEVTFDDLIRLAKEHAPPELTPELSTEEEAALRPAINAINELDGQAEALASLDKTVVFWLGQDDPYHDPMLAYARSHGMTVLSTAGDHQTGGLISGATAAAALSGVISHALGV
ncbi:MAG: alpha/beta hydrolase, partial [Pseudomonadota bacterium]